MDKRESQINEVVLPVAKRLTQDIHQIKICERVNKKMHETKLQMIRMEEEADDEDNEIYRSRFQSSYVFIEKEFPQEIPPDDESMEESEYTPEYTKKDLLGARTYDIGISTMNDIFDSGIPRRLNDLNVSLNAINQRYALNTSSRDDQTETVRQSDISQRERKRINMPSEDMDMSEDRAVQLEVSSQRSSSHEKEYKQSSISSKTKTQFYGKDTILSKTGSERKSMAHWIDSEKEEFKAQLSIHGKNWKRISQIITNKTEKQIRNFYQNYKKKMNLEELLPSHEKQKSKKKSTSPLSGLKRAKSFTRSISPFKKGTKKKKAKIVSSEESELSEIEEVKKADGRRKEVISESSSRSGSSSSSSDSEEESVESSLSGRSKGNKYDSGSDLD
jgi:hypothetical protein